jgi:hypothetical protein
MFRRQKDEGSIQDSRRVVQRMPEDLKLHDTATLHNGTNIYQYIFGLNRKKFLTNVCRLCLCSPEPPLLNLTDFPKLRVDTILF